TVIVGGGQAGLSLSYYLRQQGREHVVLEQSDAPGNAWRHHRWDSFTLNTPNWQSQLPAAEHQGSDPDCFMSRNEIVTYLERCAGRFQLPARFGTRVERIGRNDRWGSYLGTSRDGPSILARNVVVAEGL